MANLPKHQPVLLEQVRDLLEPQAGEAYLDLTAGFGGHAQDILAKTGKAESVLVDRDQTAYQFLKDKFKASRVLHSDYLTAVQKLSEEGWRADLILMDLGLSSPQLDDPERGFSFNQTGPLDMRMDQREQLKASDLVNHLNYPQLADLIYKYGEEHRSRAIARAIIQARPIANTADLADIIARTIGRHGPIHPATRTFQALRIAVNNELEQLQKTLELSPTVLKPGGRIAVISFHSLEDRIVKQFFKSDPRLEPLTKKPLMGKDLDVSNPRARSAKLRAARRLANGRNQQRDKNQK